MVGPPFAMTSTVDIIAHRGYSARAPENTISALTLALDEGATAVEFDLHTSRDGNLVLLHDHTVNRTTDGAGNVSERSLRELAKLDAGSWFDPAFEGERLPSLVEALDSIKSRVKTVFAELKGLAGIQDVRKVVSVTRAAGLLERTVFIAMDWSLLDQLQRHAPEALIGPIVERRNRTRDAFTHIANNPHCLLNFDAQIILEEPEIALYAERHGVELAAWTVDNISDASRLLDLGVRRITTNQVERMLAWKRAL